ncbi:trypsin, alkaline C-like [Vanessa atalanta]|uniref:trypsin, alkaline C-like n=1 Tax=Vanessa atalanta TaxID=42275 RepID=UPI001FCD4B12|nr:trypsin, alkaline C-like [Vanessa atalanta]
MYVITLLALVGVAIAAPNALVPRIVEESAIGALDQRIVGGSDAKIEDYPFMAVILVSNEDQIQIRFRPICGGSLITTRAVLTAAHCFLNNILSTNHFRVRLGSSLRRFGGQRYRVENWVKHPGYSWPKLYHDIAILKLATPAILSNRVALARIAGPNYIVPDNTTVTAAGWGVLEFGGEPPEILQHVDIKTINHDICRENYAELQSSLGELEVPNVTSEMVCAGILDVGGKNTCQGDSGGPLLHQGVIIGITSWAHQCAHPKYHTVFVNVPSYTSWIVDNV